MSAQKSDQLLVQPIIVKKKVMHGGHHGGAWKVAYADFVTAMMALFIVLWLMSSSEPVKKAIAGYFKDPSGHSSQNGTGQSGASENIGVGKDDMGKLKDKLEAAIRQTPDVAKLKDQVQMTVTGEGLRIELLESAVSTFFETGNAQPTGTGQEMLELLASELGKLPNRLSVEGHTDSKPYISSTGYSNWELSSDRANAARKLIQQSGVRADQVADVRGYADQRLRKPDDPMSASNRRVSIVVKYQAGKDSPGPAAPSKEPGKDAGPAAESRKATPGATPPTKIAAQPASEKPSPLGSSKPEASSQAKAASTGFAQIPKHE